MTTNLTGGDPPPTRKVAVSDSYHGIKVTEDYRWLENWDDPEVNRWSELQNQHARDYLDRIPQVDPIRKRVTQIMSEQAPSYGSLSFREGKLFAIHRAPPREQPFLTVRNRGVDDDSFEIVVDPNSLDPDGATSIDWYVPSPDGSLVAVSLSKSGTESGDVYIFETDTGKQQYEVIPRVNGGTAGGDLAWSRDGRGFFYTRYPRGDERPEIDFDFYQQLYFHQLGTPTEADRYELGEGLPRIAEIQIQSDHNSDQFLVTVQDGDGGQFAHFLRTADGNWKEFSTYGDGWVQATFLDANHVLVVSLRGTSRGQLLKIPIEALDSDHAQVLLDESEETILTDFWGSPSVLATETLIYVVYQQGGPATIRVFDHQGNLRPGPQIPSIASVDGLTRLQGDEVLYEIESFTDPPAYFHFKPESQKTEQTSLATVSSIEFDDVVVSREFATSLDGTQVPLTVLMKKGTQLDGTNPCLVTGYGGYGICITPHFSPTLKVLLEQGFVYVVANIRGGGEYGADWHRQGNLTNKQNVFDDFAAVLEHVLKRNYTSSMHLAIIGGSNGGLLMGATLTQHPELLKCVVARVGIYDMLRVELSPNGAFNIPEFGSVEEPAQFAALQKYSPYHNVSEGTKYPAVLFTTGANDPRVDPMQSRKMTARLQAATDGSVPILLRTSANSGHGGDTALSEKIEQTVDIYSFLFHELGVEIPN